MKYELIEPTVEAFKVTAVQYLLDDGSTRPAADQSAVGNYLIDGQDGIVAASDFEAKYRPLA